MARLPICDCGGNDAGGSDAGGSEPGGMDPGGGYDCMGPAWVAGGCDGMPAAGGGNDEGRCGMGMGAVVV
jgi:hypothetical protein